MIDNYSAFKLNEITSSLQKEFDESMAKDFQLYLFGSLGRSEASYNFDRDSLIVFNNNLASETREQIISKIALVFDQLKINECPEKMSFSYSNWNGDINEWKARLETWSKSYNPKEAINLYALTSARLVFGNGSLFNLKENLARKLHSDASSLYILFFINFINIFRCNTKRVLKDITEFSFLFNRNLQIRNYQKDLEILVKHKIVIDKNAQKLNQYLIRYTLITYPEFKDQQRSLRPSLAQRVFIHTQALIVAIKVLSKILFGGIK